MCSEEIRVKSKSKLYFLCKQFVTKRILFTITELKLSQIATERLHRAQLGIGRFLVKDRPFRTSV